MSTTGAQWSLRKRLTRRVLGLVIGGWLATIVLSVLVLDHEMNEMFDKELTALVEVTVQFLDSADTAEIPRNLGIGIDQSELILRLLSQTAPPPPAPWPALTGDGFHDAPGWRILRRSAEGMVIEAAQSDDERREEVLEVASAFLVLTLPLIGLLLLGLRRITTTAVVPIGKLATEIAARRPDDLSQIAGHGLPQELQPFVSAFGGYVSRIDRIRAAERDFAANAAHELRTPLAAIRARLELSDDPDAAASVPMIDALTRRVERLLQLARSEAEVGIGQGPADLLRILQLLVDDMRPRSRHPIRFDDGDLDRLLVCSDPDALAILLRNLLENAVEHGHGEVRLRLSPDASLTIENPTLNPELTQTRFQRGEGSEGLGLGLSIITALAQAMGVSLDQRVVGDTVRFTLVFKQHQT